jgi:hypothetical protein
LACFFEQKLKGCGVGVVSLLFGQCFAERFFVEHASAASPDTFSLGRSFVEHVPHQDQIVLASCVCRFFPGSSTDLYFDSTSELRVVFDPILKQLLAVTENRFLGVPPLQADFARE